MATGGGGGSGAAVKAGGAYVELFGDDSKLVASLKSARERVAKFSASTAIAGGVALTAIGGILKSLGSGATETLDEAARVGQIAQALGTPVEKLTGLFGVMKAAGQPIRESIESISQFGTAITNALEGKGENAQELFDLLKLAPEQFKGRDIAESVYAMFESLEKVKNPLDKARALSLAFGTDGMKYLLPMLNKSSAELRAQAGLYAASASDISTATAASMALSRAGAMIDKAWLKVSVALGPTIELIANAVADAAEAVADFAEKNRGLVVGIAAVGIAAAAIAATVLAVGTAAAGAGLAISGAIITLKAMGAVGAALLSPLALKMAAVGVAAVSAGIILSQFTDIFDRSAGIARTAWGGIVEAVGDGKLGLAAEIAWAGVKAVWKDALLKLQGVWTGFKDTFVDAWHTLASAVKLVVVDLMAFISRQFSQIAPKWQAAIRATGIAGAAFLGFGAAGRAMDGVFGVLDGFDADAARKGIEKEHVAELERRTMLRQNALLGAAIAAGAAQARMASLVESVKAKVPAAPSAPSFTGLPPQLAKAVGAFIGGADPRQIFGGAGGVPQKQLEATNLTNSTLKQVVVNTGNMEADLKRLAAGLSFR